MPSAIHRFDILKKTVGKHLSIMNKRKILGVIVSIVGLILTAGAASQVKTYGIAAPVTMGIILVAGLWLLFGGKKEDGQMPPSMPQ